MESSQSCSFLDSQAAVPLDSPQTVAKPAISTIIAQLARWRSTLGLQNLTQVRQGYNCFHPRWTSKRTDPQVEWHQSKSCAPTPVKKRNNKPKRWKGKRQKKTSCIARSTEQKTANKIPRVSTTRQSSPALDILGVSSFNKLPGTPRRASVTSSTSSLRLISRFCMRASTKTTRRGGYYDGPLCRHTRLKKNLT